MHIFQSSSKHRTPSQPIARIDIELQDGELVIDESWNPSLLTRSQREKLATAFREIAYNLGIGQFNVADGTEYFEPFLDPLEEEQK